MKLGLIELIFFLGIAFFAGYYSSTYQIFSGGTADYNFESGSSIIELTAIRPDGTPLANLEIDLWKNITLTGAPDAGMNVTDENGILTFSVPAGTYRIGYNANNFPSGLIPPEITITIADNETKNYTLDFRSE